MLAQNPDVFNYVYETPQGDISSLEIVHDAVLRAMVSRNNRMKICRALDILHGAMTWCVQNPEHPRVNPLTWQFSELRKQAEITSYIDINRDGDHPVISVLELHDAIVERHTTARLSGQA